MDVHLLLYIIILKFSFKNFIPKLSKLEWFNISIEYFSFLMNIKLWVGCVGDNEPIKL